MSAFRLFWEEKELGTVNRSPQSDFGEGPQHFFQGAGQQLVGFIWVEGGGPVSFLHILSLYHRFNIKLRQFIIVLPIC